MKCKKPITYTAVLSVVVFLITAATGLAQNTKLVDSHTELKPWLHVLTAEQALSSEVEKDKLTFPKEGNSWLSAVDKYDVLWSTDANDFDHNFAVRILKINASSGNVIFQTMQVGHSVVFSGLRDKVKKPDLSVEKLIKILPKELPGLQTRGFVNVSKVNESGKAYGLAYSGSDLVLKLSIGPFSKEEFNNFKKEVDNAPEEVKVTTKEYKGGTLIFIQMPMATRARFFLNGMEMRLFSRQIDTENLYTILEALDIKAIEELVVGENN